MRIIGLFILFALLPLLPPKTAQAARKTSKTRAITRRNSVPKPALAAGYAALAKNDFRGAIDAWRPLFKTARAENSTHALWPQFVQLCLENGRLDDLESAANAADSPESTPALRAAARLVVRRAAWREKRPREAQNLDENLDFMRAWQVAGPFENQAQNGFETSFAPEQADTFNKTLKGKDNKPLLWRAVPASREGMLLVGRFLSDGEAGVYYAATAINMPSARTVHLRFNHSGAAKLWLNGKFIFSDAKQRAAQNVDPDAFVITQKLAAGWNSLLLKIADEAPDETFFSLRVTTDKGGDLIAPQTDSSRFKWQPLGGQVEPAVPDLLKNFGRPQSVEEIKVLSFAQRFLSESDQAAPVIPLLSPQQISLQQKATRWAAEGQTKEAISAYQALLKYEEFLPDALQKLLLLQKQQGDVEGALGTARKLRVFRPQDAEIAVQYAELLRERGEKKEALTVYQQAMALDASQTAWRERARILAGEKALFDLVPDVPSAANSAQKADAVLLLDEARQIVYDDRASLTRFHQIIQINSANAARRYASYTLENPSPTARLTIESAKVISAGKSSDILRGATQNNLKIPTLIAGDIVDLTYRVEANQRGVLERQFWSQWFFNLAGMPVQTSRFVLITPPQVTFNIRSHGDVPAPQRRQIQSGNVIWDVREWRMENLAARFMEPLIPAPQDANLWLDISSVVTWKSVADWYRELSAKRCVPDATVRAKALEITQNAHSDEDKLRALHSYVARELREQKSSSIDISLVPESGAKIMRAGYGKATDKAALLVALCEACGIKARLALFNARRDGLTPFLPSPRFNSVMVVAQMQSGAVWLDASNADFDNLPSENQGVPALLVEEGATTLTTSPILEAENNFAATKYQAQLDESGQLKGEVETSFSGEWGAALRASWRALPTNRRAEFVSDVARLLMPAVQPAKGMARNFESADQTLKMQFAFGGAKYAASEVGILTFRLPWQELASINKALLNTEAARTQECEVAALRGLSLDTLKLQLSPGFAPQELPDEIKDASSFGRYRFNYKIEGDVATGATLIVTREVLLSPLRVSVDETPAYKAFCKAILGESGREIIVKK